MVNLLAEHISTALNAELNWLGKVMTVRFLRRFNRETEHNSIYEVTPPDLSADPSFFARFVTENELSFPERLTLILALAPHLKPESLDPLFIKNPDTDLPFTEFGGVRGTVFNGMMPTGQTALYILSEGNFDLYCDLRLMFEQEHLFARRSVLDLLKVGPGEPELSGILAVNRDFLDGVVTGKARRPKFGTEFPAKEISTNLEWSDLVLDPTVFRQLNEIGTWLEHHEELMEDWGMARMLKPGYRVLFYGPPGTGKTLCASLLGKETGQPVFRIDLSMVVSKYIGETEKNLARVFDAAQNKDWILFFDEADALFGKRTKVSDSHDRYANQEVSYLLQRVEEYAGLVILATNLKSNLDEAFTRRFQTIVHFPMPKPEERIQLWQNAFSDKSVLDKNVNLQQIASDYEMSGGAIINVVQYCSLQAIKRGSNVITRKDLINGVRREFMKEGRTT